MAVGSALLAVACVFPTDRSDRISVEVDQRTLQLLVGDTARIGARVVNADGVPVGNADLVFDVADAEVAVVSSDGVARGVGEGQTDILVRSAGFAKVDPAVVTVFVSRGIVLLSVTAQDTEGENRARFGETLALTGLRLHPDSLGLVTIGAVPAEIVGYDPSVPGPSGSVEELQLRVPVVLSPAQLLLVHRNGGTAARTLEVVQEDLYDARAAPTIIDLSDGSFGNGSLSFSGDDTDWYRIITPAGDYTIRVGLRGGRVFGALDTEFAFRDPSADPFELDRGTGWRPPRRWGLEPAGVSCDLRQFAFFRVDGQLGSQLTMATRRTSPDTVDISATTPLSNLISYELSVRAGYHAALDPDPFEENDLCRSAPDLPPDGTTHELNFDTGTDVDWYNVMVGSGTQPGSFNLAVSDEIEPNNTLGTAQLAFVSDPSGPIGTRIVGEKQSLNDIDYFAVDAVAGTLLDLDVRAGAVQTAAAQPLFGRSTYSTMMVDLTLLDAAGNVLARNGNASTVVTEAPSTGTDARIRYVVPTSGRYYLSITGESNFGEGAGPDVYYGVDIMAHPLVGSLQVDLTGADPGSDPRLLVIERRETGLAGPAQRNVTLFAPGPDAVTPSYALPVTDGAYYLVVHNAALTAAPYEIRVQVVP